MKFFLLTHAAIALCAAVAFARIFDFSAGVSFALGALVMWADVAVLAIGVPYLFAKKQFALSIGVIVFKFAILAWIMNEAVKASSPTTASVGTPILAFSLGWFAVGIALVNVSALVTAVKFSRS